jgi:hypothetical protein
MLSLGGAKAQAQAYFDYFLAGASRMAGLIRITPENRA